MTPTFQGEVLMRRWSDSSTQGVQVTFALPDASDLEPLKAKTGKRFMAVLVEIADDETLVQPDAGNPVSEKPKGGEWAKLAGMWCNDPEFWMWANTQTRGDWDIRNADDAAEFVRTVCDIKSRVELDHKAVALNDFNKYVRHPFMKWLQARGITK